MSYIYGYIKDSEQVYDVLQHVFLKLYVSLPTTFRSIVRLHCFRQLSFSEIGRMLNMPEPTVKTYFFRSLPRLRRELTSSVRFTSIS